MRKKGAFLHRKIELSPSNPTSEKIIASFKVFSWFDTIIHQKIEKVSQKKNIFSMILLAIILLPLKYPIWAMAKLRQFSPFLQQINKSVPYPFSKIQTRAPSLFPFVRYPNLHKSKTPIKYMSGKGAEIWNLRYLLC